MRIAVVGASGYIGLELLRLVLRHPELELVAATSEQRAGRAVGEAFPSLRGLLDLEFEPVVPTQLAKRADACFTALPHAASAPVVAALRKAGMPVVDLSADYRLRKLETYQAWYGVHAAPELFGQAVYGLPEIYREELRGADLAASAGCYPTASLLPLLPFLREGLVEPRPILVDAKSGISGAGRTLDERYLFAERQENAQSYKVANHRHIPEIEQEASLAAGEEVGISFVPQLIPTIRGILTTLVVVQREALDNEAARQVLERAYAEEAFVRVLPQDETPSLAAVRGSNFCDVSVISDERNGTLILLSAIDNLVKGGSGQALQCLNLMQGFPETAGLLEAPLVP